MIILLLLLYSCQGNFEVYKQKVNFNNELTKEKAFKVTLYVTNKFGFQLAKASKFESLFLVKEIKANVQEELKVKAKEKIENKQILLMIAISNEGILFRPFVKKEVMTLDKKSQGKSFKETSDDDISKKENKFVPIEKNSEEEKLILDLINNITELLKIKMDVEKVKELDDEEMKLFSDQENAQDE